MCSGVRLLWNEALCLEKLQAHYANQTLISGEFVLCNNIKIKSLCLYFQKSAIGTKCVSVGIRNHSIYSQ